MRKVYSRIKYILDMKVVDKAYILASNCREVKMYKRDICIKTEVDEERIIILNINNIEDINVDTDMIILCSRWYLNRLAELDEMKRVLGKCYSVPVDEIGG